MATRIMMTLCCTRALLKRVAPQGTFEAKPPTCALGNWFANLFRFHAQPVVIAMSEVAYIPVLFPARSLRDQVVPTFLQAVASLLSRIGASRGTIDREVAMMSPVLVSPTYSKQALGVMNQFVLEARLIARHRPSTSLSELELHFASGIVGPLGLAKPRDAALRLLNTPGGAGTETSAT